MAGYYTDKNGNLVKFAGSDTETKFALPVGSIFPSAIPLTDASVHLLDGSSISQTGVYQEFAELVKSLSNAGYNITCSQEEFDSEVSTTGNCGKFVINNTANTIRLPKITRFIQGLSSMIDIGKSLEAGLPNITGEETSGRGSSFTGISGAFSEKLNTSGKELLVYQTASLSTSMYHQIFDASLSNSIYGNSATVQPQATSFPYYIVLASGFYSDVNLDLNNIVADLNLKQEKLQASTISLGHTHKNQNDTVVEYYVSSDRYTWYRIWASGWKECGGVLSRETLNYNRKITFPVQLNNSPSAVFIQGLNLQIDTALSWHFYSANNITNTSMTIAMNTDFDRSWYVAGY